MLSLVYSYKVYNNCNLDIINIVKIIILFRQRHRREVACAYGFAFAFTLGAIIANFVPDDTLDKCSHGRPRFGENKCFYSGKKYLFSIIN